MTIGGKTSPADLETIVEAFELARRKSNQATIHEFVPDPQHADYSDIVVELARVDLEFSIRQHRPRRLRDYQSEFPDVFLQPAALERLAFEEYRLTCHGRAGEGRSPADYSQEYGIDTSDWPEWSAVTNASRAEIDRSRSPNIGRGTNSDEVALTGCEQPGAAGRFPEIGSAYGDFEIICELGRGACARVYRARQGELALRHVVLKITVEANLEPQRLAELQHTNIVPIHSVHHEGNLQAVCMPYLGSTTLADFLSVLRQHESIPSMAGPILEKFPAKPAGAAPPQTAPQGGMVSFEERSGPLLARLSNMSYEQAVVWIGAQIADGLEHAHRRGVIHRDLKPANILIGNDGVPLILDFNLSAVEAGRGADRAIVGGTLPYMAPEHMDALQTGVSVGPQSDLYSLGVVLFELLTGCHPFPVRDGPPEAVIEQMRADRSGAAPSVREYNSRVSPDVAAVVARCLAANPEHRYESAQQLHTDLDRHLRNLPPHYVRSRSLRERAKKWVRRHPRLTSATTVGAAAILIALLMTAGLATRIRQLQTVAANQMADALSHAVAESSTPLAVGPPNLGLSSLTDSIEDGRELLQRHGALQSSDWRQLFPLTRLNEAEQRAYRQDITELQYLVAAGQVRAAKHVTDPERKQELLQESARLLRLTLSEVPTNSPAILDLQARIADSRGDASLAEELRRQHATAVAGSQFERYLELLSSGRGAADNTLAEQLCGDLPHHPMVWLIQANLHYAQLRLEDAEFCYTKCISLEPKSFAAHWLRGITRFSSGNLGGADEDFEKVVGLRPDWGRGWFNHGVIRRAQGRLAEAEADMTRALNLGATESRIYFTRSALRRERGNSEGAEEDRLSGLALTPTDAPNWVARGVENYTRAPEQALHDFQQALELDPLSVPARTNIASLLAERLNRTAEAVEALDQLVALTPSSAASHALRGVLQARLDRRTEAVRDAVAALKLDDGYEIKYLVAGIYAQNARKHPADAQRAILYLQDAAWQKADYVAANIRIDKDLQPLHETPEFRKLLRLLAALRPPRKTL